MRSGGRKSSGGGGGLELGVVNGGVVGLGDLGGAKAGAGATTKLERLAGGLGSLNGNGNGNGNGKKKGGDARRQRFTSRRTSQRLESDDCSVASLRGR